MNKISKVNTTVHKIEQVDVQLPINYNMQPFWTFHNMPTKREKVSQMHYKKLSDSCYCAKIKVKVHCGYDHITQDSIHVVAFEPPQLHQAVH